MPAKSTPNSTPAAAPEFRRRLLRWFRKHGRDLPWRETRDPYRILVSEIMLQQTQVDRVLPKYEEWLERYRQFWEASYGRLDALLELMKGEVRSPARSASRPKRRGKPN